MAHEIYPDKLDNSYKNKSVTDSDRVMVFKDRCVLIRKIADKYALPEYKDIKENITSGLRYLFSIEGRETCGYFLAQAEHVGSTDGLVFLPLSEMRYIKGEGFKEIYFTVCTAYHLYKWYADNRFCGRCSGRMIHSDSERMLCCEACGNQVYPRINPAVIVGVTDGDRILLTRYAGRAYKGYALVAGFIEIGETPEQTVCREVSEETGLKVKNIRYYKSQPGGIDGNVLTGFFCELDGDDTITMDKTELAEANWYSRDEITVEDDGYSLTREMIIAFKNGAYALK